jgi:glycosyltransferase involved in cell wall biosynthesis
MPRFFQYHPSIVGADAIGYSIQRLHKMFRRLGHSSFLICQDSERKISVSEACKLSALFSVHWRRDDVLIIHHSFFNESMETLLDIPARKILVYHNITPGQFFRDIGMTHLGELADAGRSQLLQATAGFDLAVGVSDFNTNELRDLGYSACYTIPVFYDDAFFSSPWMKWTAYRALKESNDVNIAFVGRIVPNKRPDKLIETLAEYQRLFRRNAMLHLVGKIWNEDYVASLMTGAARQGVLSRIRMHIGAPQLQVKTVLAAADAFVSFSEHEGFMVPLLEAFTVGCPVIAYRAGAIPETMGGAGIGIDEPDPALAAGLIELLKRDRVTRRRIIAGQASRAVSFRSEITEQHWIDLLQNRLGVELRAS